MFQRLILIILLMAGTVIGSSAESVIASTADNSTPGCEEIGTNQIEVCDDFLAFWDANGGLETFGAPLTDELSIDVLDSESLRSVQYFEYARFERHEDLEDTPYAVQLGRLGSEILANEDLDAETASDADPDDPFYSDRTGQSIAPEFQEHWSSRGLDFDDSGTSHRESLALAGYPLTPAMEIDRDGETVLVQWFERSRMELDDSGNVDVAPLGTLANDDSDGLSLRVRMEIEATLDTIFEHHEAPGLGVWIESSDVGNWEWSLGVADFERDEPYTSDTHHRIGSVTKPIVASVVLQLVDDGLLDLDDTVDQWFPELDGADQVTIRMLGTMTSGIYNYSEVLAWFTEVQNDRERVWEPEELLEYAFGMTGTVEPDGTWEYSNTNYVMLGLIIEDVTGNDLADELETRVFEPLGLGNTSFPEAGDATLPEPYARGMSALMPRSPAEDSTDWNPSWAHAAGQIISTPSDMLAWAPEMYDGALLSDEMRAAQHELVSVQADELLEDAAAEDDDFVESGYGFGLIYGDGWYAHDGLVFGYATMTGYRPDLDASVVVLSNSDVFSSDWSLAPGLAFYTVQQILEREYPRDGS